MIFRSRRGGDGRGAVSERDTGADHDRTAGVSASMEGLFEQIDATTRANRERRHLEGDRRILRLRHLAGIQLLARAPSDPDFAVPAFDLLPDGPGLPEVAPDRLTPELLRAAILRHGCLLVRGLVDPNEALRLAAEIDRAFQARTALAAGESAPEGYYEAFKPEPPFRTLFERPWVEEGGGVLAVDSPKPMFDMLEAFDRVGLPGVVHGYLGEHGAISAQKCTLRKAEPQVPGGWHQDGAFLGEVHALNLWLSLSRCGDDAPGLDLVPRRIDHLVATGTEGTNFGNQVSQAMAEEAAGGVGIQRPIFNPGDALMFDELFLHKTGSDARMPNPRYAVESWFFGPSAFPGDYSPLAA